MRKQVSSILAFTLLLTLSSCNNGGQSKANNTPNQPISSGLNSKKGMLSDDNSRILVSLQNLNSSNRGNYAIIGGGTGFKTGAELPIQLSVDTDNSTTLPIIGSDDGAERIITANNAFRLFSCPNNTTNVSDTTCNSLLDYTIGGSIQDFNIVGGGSLANIISTPSSGSNLQLSIASLMDKSYFVSNYDTGITDDSQVLSMQSSGTNNIVAFTYDDYWHAGIKVYAIDQKGRSWTVSDVSPGYRNKKQVSYKNTSKTRAVKSSAYPDQPIAIVDDNTIFYGSGSELALITRNPSVSPVFNLPTTIPLPGATGDVRVIKQRDDDSYYVTSGRNIYIVSRGEGNTWTATLFRSVYSTMPGDIVALYQSGSDLLFSDGNSLYSIDTTQSTEAVKIADAPSGYVIHDINGIQPMTELMLQNDIYITGTNPDTVGPQVATINNKGNYPITITFDNSNLLTTGDGIKDIALPSGPITIQPGGKLDIPYSVYMVNSNLDANYDSIYALNMKLSTPVSNKTSIMSFEIKSNINIAGLVDITPSAGETCDALTQKGVSNNDASNISVNCAIGSSSTQKNISNDQVALLLAIIKDNVYSYIGTEAKNQIPILLKTLVKTLFPQDLQVTVVKGIDDLHYTYVSNQGLINTVTSFVVQTFNSIDQTSKEINYHIYRDMLSYSNVSLHTEMLFDPDNHAGSTPDAISYRVTNTGTQPITVTAINITPSDPDATSQFVSPTNTSDQNYYPDGQLKAGDVLKPGQYKDIAMQIIYDDSKDGDSYNEAYIGVTASSQLGNFTYTTDWSGGIMEKPSSLSKPVVGGVPEAILSCNSPPDTEAGFTKPLTPQQEIWQYKERTLSDKSNPEYVFNRLAVGIVRDEWDNYEIGSGTVVGYFSGTIFVTTAAHVVEPLFKNGLDYQNLQKYIYVNQKKYKLQLLRPEGGKIGCFDYQGDSLIDYNLYYNEKIDNNFKGKDLVVLMVNGIDTKPFDQIGKDNKSVYLKDITTIPRSQEINYTTAILGIGRSPFQMNLNAARPLRLNTIGGEHPYLNNIFYFVKGGCNTKIHPYPFGTVEKDYIPVVLHQTGGYSGGAFMFRGNGAAYFYVYGVYDGTRTKDSKVFLLNSMSYSYDELGLQAIQNTLLK